MSYKVVFTIYTKPWLLRAAYLQNGVHMETRCKVSVYQLVSRYKNDLPDSLATHGEVIFLPISIVKTPGEADALNMTFNRDLRKENIFPLYIKHKPKQI